MKFVFLIDFDRIIDRSFAKVDLESRHSRESNFSICAAYSFMMLHAYLCVRALLLVKFFFFVGLDGDVTSWVSDTGQYISSFYLVII